MPEHITTYGSAYGIARRRSQRTRDPNQIDAPIDPTFQQSARPLGLRVTSANAPGAYAAFERQQEGEIADRARMQIYRPDIGIGMTDAEYAQRQQEASRQVTDEERRQRDMAPAVIDGGGGSIAQETRSVQSSARPTAADPSLRDAYASFLGRPSITTTSSVASAPAVDTSAITRLAEQVRAEQARQQAERAAMRDLLMQRIGEASKPVDVKAPGIRELLSAQRLARQRSAERQQSQVAARLSQEGLLDSGAFDTASAAIEQGRGEGEAADIGAALLPEHQAKRQELLQLYQTAVAMGDTEAARTLQAQLAAIDATLAAQNQQEGQRRFNADLGFRKSSFLDNLNLQLLMAGMR